MILRNWPSSSFTALCLLVVLGGGCARAPAPDEAAASGPRIDAAGVGEGAAPDSRAQPHLDGTTFTGDVAPGAAAAGLIGFLESHVGAIVVLDLAIAGFEGEIEPTPGWFWLRPDCEPGPGAGRTAAANPAAGESESAGETADGGEAPGADPGGAAVAAPCRHSHVAIEGSPELFARDDDPAIVRLRGRFGIEAPEDPTPEVRAWRLVADPLRRSELVGSGGSGAEAAEPVDGSRSQG